MFILSHHGSSNAFVVLLVKQHLGRIPGLFIFQGPVTQHRKCSLPVYVVQAKQYHQGRRLVEFMARSIQKKEWALILSTPVKLRHIHFPNKLFCPKQLCGFRYLLICRVGASLTQTKAQRAS